MGDVSAVETVDASHRLQILHARGQRRWLGLASPCSHAGFITLFSTI